MNLHFFNELGLRGTLLKMTIGGTGTTRRFSTGGRRTTQVGRSLFLNGKQATTREARMKQSVRKRRNLTPYLGRMAHTGARILVKTTGAVDRPNQRILNLNYLLGITRRR